MSQRPSSWTDHLDDVSGGGVHVGNIRSIDPRVARTKALLAAGADDNGRS